MKFQPAYLVTGWATELVVGYGSVPIKEKDWISHKIIFTEDKVSYSFEYIGTTKRDKGVFFDFQLAEEALQHQKNSYKNYIKEQIEKYQKELKEL